MSHMAINSEKLAKLLALASSTNDHEALAALRKANELLTGAGMSFVDVAQRMATPKTSVPDFDFAAAWAAAQRQSKPKPEPKSYTDRNGNTWRSKAEHDRYAAQQRVHYEAARQRCAADRAAIIAKYGNAAKAAARNDREQALHDAVVAWIEADPACKPKGRWSQSLDGWTAYQSISKASPRAVAAIRAALPMPKTLAEAKAELAYWEVRSSEVQIATEDYERNGSGLDLPAELRRDIIHAEIASNMPAASFGDLIERLEWSIAEFDRVEAHDALAVILADVKRLAPAPARPRPTKRTPSHDFKHPDLFANQDSAR